MHIFSVLAGLGIALAAAPAQAQAPTTPAPPVALQPAVAPESAYPASAIGLTLGWGAPYGWSIDFAHMVTSHLDVNFGLGFSITGTKVGVGTRYYLAPQRKVSPFFGVNLVRSGGINDLRVTANNSNNGGPGTSGDEAIVNFKSAGLVHVRSGLRWQPHRGFALLGALGYGMVLGGSPVEYVRVPAQQSTRDAVNIFSPGGIEFSVGMALGLGAR